MKIFKNKLGRPSNKYKRNKKILIACLIALVISICCSNALIITSYNKKNNEDNVIVSKANEIINNKDFESLKKGDWVYARRDSILRKKYSETVLEQVMLLRIT